MERKREREREGERDLEEDLGKDFGFWKEFKEFNSEGTKVINRDVR